MDLKARKMLIIIALMLITICLIEVLLIIDRNRLENIRAHTNYYQHKIDSLESVIIQSKNETQYHLTRSDSADAVREVLKEKLKFKSKQYEKAYKNIDNWTIHELDSVLSATN